MSLVGKAALQNRMAVDVIIALQGGTCAISQADCFMFIPDESANVPSLLNHIRAQVNALSDPTPNLEDSIMQCFRS